MRTRYREYEISDWDKLKLAFLGMVVVIALTLTLGFVLLDMQAINTYFECGYG